MDSGSVILVTLLSLFVQIHSSNKVTCLCQGFWTLMYFRSVESPNSMVENEVGGNKNTVVDWANFMRDICCNWVRDNPATLGGVDDNGQPIVVQIDETKYFHRKYARREWHEGHWVVGGVDTQNPHNAFLTEVPDRWARTLLPIIQNHVEMGSMIHTDQWSAYNTIANLPEGYGHQMVNHRHFFVDPQTGVHTQNIEGFWGHAKKRIKRINGMSRELFQSYLCEFEWHWRNNTYHYGGGRVFQKLLVEVRHQYPL